MHDRPRVARFIAAVALAAATWGVVLNGSMLVLRSVWEAYAVAHTQRAYSLAMLLIRLAIFAATIGATSAVATIVSRQPWMPWLAGAIVLALSVPDHLYPGRVWGEFPAWYHVVYLACVVPVALVAGRAAHAIGTRRAVVQVTT